VAASGWLEVATPSEATTADTASQLEVPGFWEAFDRLVRGVLT